MKKIYTGLTPKEVTIVKESAIAMNLHTKNKGKSEVIVWDNCSTTINAHKNYLRRNHGILPHKTSLRKNLLKKVSIFFKKQRPF